MKPFQHSNQTDKEKLTEKRTLEDKNASIAELSEVPKELVELVGHTYAVSLKPTISDMTEMVIISNSTGSTYNKFEIFGVIVLMTLKHVQISMEQI